MVLWVINQLNYNWGRVLVVLVPVYIVHSRTTVNLPYVWVPRNSCRMLRFLQEQGRQQKWIIIIWPIITWPILDTLRVCIQSWHVVAGCQRISLINIPIDDKVKDSYQNNKEKSSTAISIFRYIYISIRCVIYIMCGICIYYNYIPSIQLFENQKHGLRHPNFTQAPDLSSGSSGPGVGFMRFGNDDHAL